MPRARYHDAWKQHDFAAARSLLHDDLSFHGPIDTFERADDYIDALERLQPMVEDIETERVFSDGDDVVVLFELITPQGRAPVAEWYRVDGDKIAALKVYFDARPFAPPGP
jgi:hypothetical protein